METRMLHWPDSMFTYYKNEDVLFSADAFGMHLASEERFVAELDEKIVHDEAKTYYANILMPFSGLVEGLLKSVAQTNLPIKMIAPDHGPIWTSENLNTPIENYTKWSGQKRNKTAVIAYDTMWKSTAKLAEAVAEGLRESGAHAHVMPLEACERSDIALELLEAGAFIVGSPTLNNNLLPRIADILTYIKGLKPKGMIGGSFGSFGWSGEAC
jgi:flavorubredoxin